MVKQLRHKGVSDMAQEDGYLQGCDETAFSCGGVAVHRRRAVGSRIEAPHSPDNVEARAHPVQGNSITTQME